MPGASVTGELSPWWVERVTNRWKPERVSRAATQVHPADLRPTGALQFGRAARIFQQQLNKRLAAAATDEDRRWRRLLTTEVRSVTADPFLPDLAERLSNLTRAGFDAALLVRSAAAAGPLPDDYPAAALWWRILDRPPPQMPRQDPGGHAVPATRRRSVVEPAPQIVRLPGVQSSSTGPTRSAMSSAAPHRLR